MAKNATVMRTNSTSSIGFFRFDMQQRHFVAVSGQHARQALFAGAPEMAMSADEYGGFGMERVAEALLAAAGENYLRVYRKRALGGQFGELVHKEGVSAGEAAKIRGERHGMDCHEGDARLQARSHGCGFAQESARQAGVGVRDYEFQVSVECVRAELARVDPKFTASLHVDHLIQSRCGAVKKS